MIFYAFTFWKWYSMPWLSGNDISCLDFLEMIFHAFTFWKWYFMPWLSGNDISCLDFLEMIFHALTFWKWYFMPWLSGNDFSCLYFLETIIDALNFYAPGLKGLLGASSNRIVHPSVCLSVHLSVRNSVRLTNKLQYLKFGWSYSNQTWTVSSSIGSSHFTDIPYPWGWGGVKM